MSNHEPDHPQIEAILADRRAADAREYERFKKLLPHILSIGDPELVERVTLSKDEDRHVTLGAVEAILEMPDELRKEAVKIVVHSQMQPLHGLPARDVLRVHLLEPWEEERHWNANKRRFVTEWRSRLQDQVGQEAMNGIELEAVDWKDALAAVRKGVDPLDEIAAEDKYPEAPERLTWLDLAKRHGLTVQVVPLNNKESHWEDRRFTGKESWVLLASKILREAEESREEHGAQPWLISDHQKRKKTENKNRVWGKPEPQRTTSPPPAKRKNGLETVPGNPDVILVGESDGITYGIRSDERKNVEWVEFDLYFSCEVFPVPAEVSGRVQKDFLRRLRRNLSQQQVETRSGVSFRTWEGWEQAGKRKLPFQRAEWILMNFETARLRGAS